MQQRHTKVSIHFWTKYSDLSDWQFEQIKLGLPSAHFSCARNLLSVHWIHISLDALLEYASRQYRHKVSLEPSPFVSLAFFDFLMFFEVSFVNISLEILHTLLFPLVSGAVFLICSKTCVVVFFFKANFTTYQSKWQFFSSACLHSDSFWVRL